MHIALQSNPQYIHYVCVSEMLHLAFYMKLLSLLTGLSGALYM